MTGFKTISVPTVSALTAGITFAGFGIGITSAAADVNSYERTYYLGTAADGVTRTATFQCGASNGYPYVDRVALEANDVSKTIRTTVKTVTITNPPLINSGMLKVSWSTSYNINRPNVPAIKLTFGCSKIEPNSNFNSVRISKTAPVPARGIILPGTAEMMVACPSTHPDRGLGVTTRAPHGVGVEYAYSDDWPQSATLKWINWNKIIEEVTGSLDCWNSY
ncbi:hypothetical protein ACFVZH_40365 [Streptomyces sp. NPDC059534]|uniref:hypothetical protein n=1 Tax=Streptomyces sp. NPDC059534 TaxID=3346859 RepID=UPI003696E8B2